MKKLLMFICVLLIWACQKEPDNCKGCGYFSTTTRQFTIKGQLVEDCTGKPSANKKLRAFLLPKTDTTVFQTITVGADGKFEFTYTTKHPNYVPATPRTTQPFLIEVLDDSLQYIIPATIEFSNLVLNLNDPINYKVNTTIAADSRPFTAADTLICYFFSRIGPDLTGHYPIFLKKVGPFMNGTIGTIKGRMKIININEKGQPFIHLSWDFSSGSSYSSSSADTATSTIMPCTLRQDSIVLILKR